jgi:hypothetical protein
MSAKPVPKPNIRAEFVMDQDHLSFIKRGDLKHYKIVLSVKDPPPDVQAITFDLHPTYYDPKREVGPESGFKEQITSYGDYNITATALGAGGQAWAVKSLADALRESYEGQSNPEILKAIEDIASH